MTFNLLTELVFRVETGESSHVTASLPEVYAALMRDDVVAFPALRPHQRHAWHAFLVQLGAMALRGREGETINKMLRGGAGAGQRSWQAKIVSEVTG